MINTWFWHGIENLGEVGSNELIIGAPARYMVRAAATQSNFLYTLNSFIYMYSRFGNDMFKTDFKFDLQRDITNDRRSREGKAMK